VLSQIRCCLRAIPLVAHSPIICTIRARVKFGREGTMNQRWEVLSLEAKYLAGRWCQMACIVYLASLPQEALPRTTRAANM
jgi:hypothetical protein